MSAFVYLLHFNREYPGGQKPQHYLGVTRDLSERMAEHERGSAKSRLMRACFDKKIGFLMVAHWTFATPKEAFDHERRMKAKKKGYRAVCPICRHEKLWKDIEDGVAKTFSIYSEKPALTT